MSLSTIHIFLGVDPGLKGGLFYVDFEKNIALSSSMPVQASETGSGKANVAPEALDAWIKRLPATPQICALEDVYSMPRDGVVSAFTFGEGKGIVRGVMACNKIKVVPISPSVWKKDFNLLKNKLLVGESRQRTDAKQRAIALARATYKNCADQLLTSEGICEASLIAIYCALQYGPRAGALIRPG